MAQKTLSNQELGLNMLLIGAKKYEERFSTLEVNFADLQNSITEQNRKLDDMNQKLDRLINTQEKVDKHDSAFKKITKVLIPDFMPSSQ